LAGSKERRPPLKRGQLKRQIVRTGPSATSWCRGAPPLLVLVHWSKPGAAAASSAENRATTELEPHEQAVVGSTPRLVHHLMQRHAKVLMLRVLVGSFLKNLVQDLSVPFLYKTFSFFFG
jgi:hypothetical protein